MREQTAGVGKRFFGGYRRFFAPSKKWGYISNENGGFFGTVKTVPYRDAAVSKKGFPEDIAFPLRGRWHEVPDEVFLRLPPME